MAGMALLLMCTVAAEGSGWQSGQISGPVVTRQLPSTPVSQPAYEATPITQGLPTVSVAQNPALPGNQPTPAGMATNPITGLPAPPAAVPPATADWSDIENALRLPPGNPSRSHAGFPALRSADGLDLPPPPPTNLLSEPPAAVPARNPAAIGLPSAPVRNEPVSRGTVTSLSGGLPANQPINAGPTQGLGPAPALNVVPEARPATARNATGFENRRTQGSFSDRKYISPPPTEPAVVVPVKNPDPVEENRSTHTQPLPGTNENIEKAKLAAELGGVNPVAEPSSGRWWPLLLTMLGLFASVGFNLYLGWIAFDIHGRYHDIADEIQDLEQKLEENGVRSDASERRRASAKHRVG
ncbi:MAG: hypothetical protein GY768_11365 [Planctomycetaceae bacterium]|nr:hypothetical protein [Planctomycetaceae bacterium]